MDHFVPKIKLNTLPLAETFPPETDVREYTSAYAYRQLCTSTCNRNSNADAFKKHDRLLRACTFIDFDRTTIYAYIQGESYLDRQTASMFVRVTSFCVHS